MLLAENNVFYTAAQIASIANISRPAVVKRLRGIDSSLYTLIPNPSGTGRPVIGYKPEVMELFGRVASDLCLPNAFRPRKRRSDVGSVRKCRSDIEEITLKIIADVKDAYMNQALADAVRPITRNIINQYEALGFLSFGSFEEREKYIHYVYNNRIQRKEARGEGVFHSERWDIEWSRLHKKSAFNNDMPTLRYENYKLWETAGLAGPGFGAGSLMVIDGTQFDVWSEFEGKKKLFNYLKIHDALTGFPLLIAPLEKGESIDSVLRIISLAVEVYGVPRLGFVLDNSRTFVSNAVQGFIKSLYSDDSLDFIENCELLRCQFPGQSHPAKYPLRKLPHSINYKAAIEQSFNQATRQTAMLFPASFQGSTERRSLSYELGSVPVTALAMAPNFKDSWNTFMSFVYTKGIDQFSPSVRRRFADRGMEISKISETFEHYGGICQRELSAGDEILNLELGIKNPNFVPLESVPAIIYYLAGDDYRHEVKLTKRGNIAVRHNSRDYNYMTKELDFRLQGKKLTVIPLKGNEKYAYIFKEFNPKEYDALLTEPGSVRFIGKAKDATVDDIKELPGLKKERQDNQNYQAREMDKAFGKRDKPKNNALATEVYIKLREGDTPVYKKIEPAEEMPSLKAPVCQADETDNTEMYDTNSLLDQFNL